MVLVYCYRSSDGFLLQHDPADIINILAVAAFGSQIKVMLGLMLRTGEGDTREAKESIIIFPFLLSQFQ